MNGLRFHHRPNGFTILELVVALAVIGLLVSLIVPAIQSARESARRLECAAHLNELGHAISNYESLHGVLPPERGDGGFHSPLVEVLPMLEQAAFYKEMLKTGVALTFVPEDPAILNLPVLTILRCPSDGAAHGANYKFNQGSDVAGKTHGPISTPAAPSSVVTDGASNTAVMSEALISPAGGSHAFHRADAWYSGLGWQQTVDPTNEEVIQLCNAAADNPVPVYQYVGQHWPLSGLGHAGYNHVVTPNAPTLNCRLDGRAPNSVADHYWPYGLLKASSEHRGGVNVLMLDGAVRFASDNIDLQVWRAIGTRSGGESNTQF